MRSANRRHISPCESPTTSQGSVVTTISGVTDTFDGRSNTSYKNWLQLVQSNVVTHQYTSFVEKEVADQCNGVWTTGTVQCLHPFSIVWTDNTDSICV